VLAEAEKYASVDKEKRENIDLKNQAETLCFEAEKELSLFKENLSNENQQNITSLIETIRQNVQDNNFDSLKSSVTNLKTAMKDVMATKPLEDNESNSDPMSNLNDL
jgi:molecular chaperone DnaK